AVLLLVPMWIQSLTKSDFSILLQWYDDPQYLLSFPTRRSSDLDIAPLLGEADLELLKKNAKAAFYEPLVGSAAHALATVCDRVRYGTIPDAVAADATVQQAAALAANLASQVHRWAEFRATLRPHANGDVKALVLRALALGWSEKWRTS